MKHLLLFLSLISWLACGENKPNKQNDLAQFSWLIGEWMDSTSDGKMVEIWNRIDDTSFVGSSIYMAGTDTIFYEEISLRLKNGKLFYTPSIQSQNNGDAVHFAFTSKTNGEYTFENKEHDFPKKIVYTNPNKDSLVAFIEGPTKAGYQKEYFKMHRVK